MKVESSVLIVPQQIYDSLPRLFQVTFPLQSKLLRDIGTTTTTSSALCPPSYFMEEIVNEVELSTTLRFPIVP